MLPRFAQIAEEVVVQGGGDFHQRGGVDPAAGIDEIHVVAVAAQLLRQPHGTPALPPHLGPDQLANMYLCAFHFFLIQCVNKSIKKPRTSSLILRFGKTYLPQQESPRY